MYHFTIFKQEIINKSSPRCHYRGRGWSLLAGNQNYTEVTIQSSYKLYKVQTEAERAVTATRLSIPLSIARTHAKRTKNLHQATHTTNRGFYSTSVLPAI
jgi:predicted chitinase